MQKHILWIDWESHLRTRTLAQRLEIDLVEIRFSGRRFRRYTRSMLQSWAVIRKRRPEVIIATNPSIVLAYLMLALRILYGFKLVSDAHYFGVKAVHGSRILQWFLDLNNAMVDLVIVTNENHAQMLSALGARTFVCQDPLPILSDNLPVVELASSNSVFLVCSFDVDEPYEAAFESFAMLKEQGYKLFVSGNYEKALIKRSGYDGVQLLGFLPDAQYYGYLKACSSVMVLTTMDDCLVCGAYEALVLKKPLLLSKTRALVDYFGDAAMFTENTAEAIRQCVLAAHAQLNELAHKAENWVGRNERYMNERIAQLNATLSSLS